MTATSPTSSEQDQETTSQVRGSSMLLVGRLVNVVLSLGIQVLLVRTLTESEFGAFGYALAVATMMVLVVSLGTLKAIPRFLAIYEEQNDNRRFAGALIFEVGLILGLATSVFILLLSLRSLIEGRLIDDSLTFTLTAILFFTAPQEALDRVMEAVAAVAGKTRAIFIRKYLLEPSLRLTAIIALILTGASVHFLAVGYLVAGVLGSMVYFAFIVRHLRERRINRHFRKGEFDLPGKTMLRFSLPLLSHDVVFAGVGALSVILIGSSFGTGGVADFRAVFPIARMNSIISWTFAILYIPLASRFFTRGDIPGMARAYWRSAAWLTVLTLPIFLLTGVFAGTLTETMLGADYADTAPILTVLAVAYYFHASLGFNTYTLQTFGHLRLTVVIDLVSLVVFVVSASLMIPRYEALGAAWATLITYTFMNLASQVGVHRMGIAFTRRFGAIYASVIGAIGVCVLIERLLDPPLILAGVLSASTVVILVVLNKEKLEVAETFPEATRLPVIGKILV